MAELNCSAHYIRLREPATLGYTPDASYVEAMNAPPGWSDEDGSSDDVS